MGGGGWEDGGGKEREDGRVGGGVAIDCKLRLVISLY